MAVTPTRLVPIFALSCAPSRSPLAGVVPAATGLAASPARDQRGPSHPNDTPFPYRFTPVTSEKDRPVVPPVNCQCGPATVMNGEPMKYPTRASPRASSRAASVACTSRPNTLTSLLTCPDSSSPSTGLVRPLSASTEATPAVSTGPDTPRPRAVSSTSTTASARASSCRRSETITRSGTAPVTDPTGSVSRTSPVALSPASSTYRMGTPSTVQPGGGASDRSNESRLFPVLVTT